MQLCQVVKAQLTVGMEITAKPCSYEKAAPQDGQLRDNPWLNPSYQAVPFPSR